MKKPDFHAFVVALRVNETIGMARFLAVVLIGIPLCAIGAGAFAQDTRPLAPTGFLMDAPAKAPVKKGRHKSVEAAGQSAQQNADAAEKAARLAEGRKKFFDRSMGFDSGESTSSPLTMTGGDNGLMPAMGMKF